MRNPTIIALTVSWMFVGCGEVGPDAPRLTDDVEWVVRVRF
jgi:hypothetical protein